MAAWPQGTARCAAQSIKFARNTRLPWVGAIATRSRSHDLCGSGQLGGAPNDDYKIYLYCFSPSCHPAQAQTAGPYPLPPNATPNRDALPPVEDDKPFMGKLKTIRGDAYLMRTLCPKTSYDPTLACSYAKHDGTECIVILADDGIIYDAGWTPQIIWRHERGHCNGWPGNHPNSRPVTPETMGRR